MNKNKFFKNPERVKVEKYSPYVPQYKLLDKEPVMQDNSFAAKPRQKFTPPQNMPFAEPGKMVPNFPNIGNNQDNSWANLDQTIIDGNGQEFKMDQSKIIDNNDYFPDETSISQGANYILLVGGSMIMEGQLEEVEEEVRKIMFNEHETIQASYEDLMVFKRVNIKVGVFLKD